MAEKAKLDMFSYPKGIANTDNAFYKNRKVVFMAITGQSITDKGRYYYESKADEEVVKRQQQAKCCITLPLPNNLSDAQQHDWSQSTYFDAITGMLDTSNMNSSKIKEDGSTNSSFSSTFGRISASVSAGLGAVTNMIGTRKPMLNPGYFQNYSGSQLRSFSFDYKFIPRNKDEAFQICEIVKAFKQYSSPQRGLTDIEGNDIRTKKFTKALDGYSEAMTNEENGRLTRVLGNILDKGNSALKWTDETLSENGVTKDLYKSLQEAAGEVWDVVSPFQMSPFVWQIIIFNESIQKLSQIKTCACSNITVNYGEGNFDAFEDGMPKVINLQLTFAEMDLQFSNMYKDVEIELQSNNPNASTSIEVSKDGTLVNGKTQDPSASDLAGSVKKGNLIPKEEDGKSGGFLDSLALGCSEFLQGAKDFAKDVKSVADVVTGAIKDVNEVVTEVHGAVSEVSDAVRLVDNTIVETAEEANQLVKRVTKPVITRVFR